MARGLDNNDYILFNDENIIKLRQAASDIYYLLNRGYKLEPSVLFAGGHYNLTSRHNHLLRRAVCSKANLQLKKAKELAPSDMREKCLHIDGFNTIITLEVLLCGGTTYISTDGCIRDLAGLRGNYRIIPETRKAIKLIAEICNDLEVEGIYFFLDEPISNSGNLKSSIFELIDDFKCEVSVDIVRNPDVVLYDKSDVITTDSVILERCASWFHLNNLAAEKLGLTIPIDLTNL